MVSLKPVLCATGALFVMTGSASAVTVKNEDTVSHKIGINRGNSASLATIGPKKSEKFDCPEGCGFSGPWGFSWMAKGDDVITTDGKSLVTDYKGFKGHESG